MSLRRSSMYAQKMLARAEQVVTPVSRRSFLGKMSLGALTLSVPVWRSFEANAQTAANKRFFGFFTPNGTVPDQFFPTDPNLATLPPLLAGLEAFKSQLLVLKGVHMDSTIGDGKPGGPHMKGPGAMLTGGWLLEGSFTGAGGPAGYANGISVDQSIAALIGQDTRFPSLEFGMDIQGQEPLRVISYAGSNQPNNPIDDPWVMYDRIFGDFVPDTADRERVIAEQRSVIDYVKDELADLEAKLPSEDRARLEAHLTSIRNIERQLDIVGVECTQPVLGEPVDVHLKDNYPAVGKLQMDLMFQAQVCDLTRVSTFMWSNADSWQYFPWIGVDEEHHALSHLTDEASIAKLITINTWYTDQIAYFLGLLQGASVGESTMLDDSLVLWGNEIGVGDTHTHENIPWVLAGSAGGHFSTGRFIDYGSTPHNNLLLAVLQAFGAEDQTAFGPAEYNTGALPGLRI